jgi:hypothetical protein
MPLKLVVVVLVAPVLVPVLQETTKFSSWEGLLSARRVVQQLQDPGYSVISTSRDSRIAPQFDTQLLLPIAAKQINSQDVLPSSLALDPLERNDQTVNSATGFGRRGYLRRQSRSDLSYISVAPEVKEWAQD